MTTALSPFDRLTRGAEMPVEMRANQGSEEITLWCSCCLERTVPMRNGTCGFCDTPLTEEAIERETESPTQSALQSEVARTAARAEKAEAARIIPTACEKDAVAVLPDTATLGETGGKTPTVSELETEPESQAGFKNPRILESKEACIPTPVAKNLAKKLAKVGDQPRIPRRRDRRHKHGRPYTDEQILARIKLWAELLGSPPTKADWNVARLKQLEATARGTIERHLRRIALYQLGDFPSETTVRDRFGSMNAAIVMAGYEPRPTGRPPTSNPYNGRDYKHPKIGRGALTEHFEAVQGLLDDDRARLKAALYDLSLSALFWADKIAVEDP